MPRLTRTGHSSSGEFILEDLPAFHHELDSLQFGGVLQRIPGYRHEIRKLTTSAQHDDRLRRVPGHFGHFRRAMAECVEIIGAEPSGNWMTP